ncbi:MAG: UDP-3-O-(3-hydroxymyristoyl)glucosamine N-acyltransferase [Chromatiales bacterium]|nr:UDP-3-O-(3-hydroxymyristoyl)glucosamine N-acyltransferase [Chromatiales bacterium]
MGVTLGLLAVRHGCELRGEPGKVVDRVATLARADDRSLTFLANAAYRSQLADTRAAAVILAPADAGDCPVDALVTRDPYVAYARIAAELHPAPGPQPGIHPTAVAGPGVVIPASCEIGPGVVLGRGVVLGERVVLGPRTILGDRVSVGADTRLMPGVTVYAGVRIGARCVLHTGVVIGSDGFGFAREREGSYVKVPQLGSVVVGDDVEIGANTTVDRGAIDDTVIGNGVKLDNQIQVGHNVRIGEHTVIAAQTGISGSATIGARCTIGGQAGFAGHIVVADDVVIGGGTGVTGSIRAAGIYAGGGTPADQISRWRRNMARFGQLDELAKRVRSLEKRLSDLITPGSTPPGSPQP